MGRPKNPLPNDPTTLTLPALFVTAVSLSVRRNCGPFVPVIRRFIIFMNYSYDLDEFESIEEGEDYSENNFKIGTFDIGLVKNQRQSYSGFNGRPASDFSQIVNGRPVYIRKKLSYTGHASTIYSVEQAIAVVEYIGKTTRSETTLPYAISIVENGQPVSIIEDNGEFGCGKVFPSV